MKFPNDGLTIRIKKSWVLGFIGCVLGIVFTIVVSLSTGAANAESKEAQPAGKYVVLCTGSVSGDTSDLADHLVAEILTSFYNKNVPQGLKYVGPITGIQKHCTLFTR